MFFFFFKITFLYTLLVLLSYHKMFILYKIVLWITSKNFWFSYRATLGLTTLKLIQKFSKCRKTIWVFIFLKYDKFWSSISLDKLILKYKPLFFFLRKDWYKVYLPALNALFDICIDGKSINLETLDHNNKEKNFLYRKHSSFSNSQNVVVILYYWKWKMTLVNKKKFLIAR